MRHFVKKVTQSVTILAASPEDSALVVQDNNDVCDAILLIGPYVNTNGDKFHCVYAPNPQVHKSITMPLCKYQHR